MTRVPVQLWGNGRRATHKPSWKKATWVCASDKESVKCEFNSQLWIHAQFIRVAMRTDRDDEIELPTTIVSHGF